MCNELLLRLFYHSDNHIHHNNSIHYNDNWSSNHTRFFERVPWWLRHYLQFRGRNHGYISMPIGLLYRLRSNDGCADDPGFDFSLPKEEFLNGHALRTSFPHFLNSSKVHAIPLVIYTLIRFPKFNVWWHAILIVAQLLLWWQRQLQQW